MLALKKIAVTGGLASGKSVVCQIFKTLDAYVVSADEIVHQLLSSDPVIVQQVISLLGPEVLSEQKLDRKKIAEKVFPHPEKLQALEKILHAAVFKEIENRYQLVKNKTKYNLFVAEVPLLYESENEHFFDFVITISAEERTCLGRFLEKTTHSAEEFYQRTARQLPLHEKAAKSDYIIENNGNLSELKEKLIKLKSKLLFSN